MLRRLLCALLSALALTLVPAGCSSESDGSSGGSSSASSAHGQLQGTWVIDPEMAKSQPEFQEAPKAAQDMMLKLLEQMKMEMTFSASDVRIVSDMMGEKQDESRPYTVVSEEDNTLVIEATDESGVKQELTVTVEGDKLTFTDGEESFALRRK